MEQQQGQDQQQAVKNQENKQVYKLKDLKIQALLKVAKCPEISDEQVEQLPQEIRKVARVIRSTQGDITKALFKAMEIRCNVLEVIRTLEKLKSEKLRFNFDSQNLLSESYSIDDIRMIIQCASSAIVIDCNCSVKDNDGTRLALKMCQASDAELLTLLIEEKARGSIIVRELRGPNNNITREHIERFIL